MPLSRQNERKLLAEERQPDVFDTPGCSSYSFRRALPAATVVHDNALIKKGTSARPTAERAGKLHSGKPTAVRTEGRPGLVKIHLRSSRRLCWLLRLIPASRIGRVATLAVSAAIGRLRRLTAVPLLSSLRGEGLSGRRVVRTAAEHLQVVGQYLYRITFHSLLVGPFAAAQPPFDIDLRPLADETVGHIGQVTPEHHTVPFGMVAGTPCARGCISVRWSQP